MEVNIEAWKDIRKGDKWLGMEAKYLCSDSISFYGWHPVSCEINALIAAGNNIVQRKPEKVEFTTSVSEICGCSCSRQIGQDLPGVGGFPVGQKVKVTIEEVE